MRGRKHLKLHCHAQRKCLKTHRAAVVRLILWAVRVVAVVIFVLSGPHVFFIRWIFVLYLRLLWRLFIALPFLPYLSARFFVTLATRSRRFPCLGFNCLIVRWGCSVLWLMANKKEKLTERSKVASQNQGVTESNGQFTFQFLRKNAIFVFPVVPCCAQIG